MSENENENGNENGNVLTSLPVVTSVAAPSTLVANALSATTGKKAKVPLTAEQKASRKAASNATKATEEYKTKKATRNSDKEKAAQKLQKKYGKLLHGRDAAGDIIPATPLEVIRIDAAWTKLITAHENDNNENADEPTLTDAIAQYKSDLSAKPAKVKLTSAEKLNRKSIRKTLRGFKINPSAARVTAYTKRRANFKNFKPNNATAKKTLVNYFLAEKAYSPKLKGLRKLKANTKAELESFRDRAEAELKLLRTEAQVKKDAGVNPASITHLAMLRKAKYTITAKDFKELSTLVKKGDITKLKDDVRIKSLITQSAGKDACDRCILTNIFGVYVK